MKKRHASSCDSSNNTELANLESRRKFLVKASIATPLITTIASKSAWAGGGSVCSLSGNLSGNLSDPNPQEVCTYNTYSPGGWLQGSATGVGSNANLWIHILPFSRQSQLMDLFPNCNFAGTIRDALSGGKIKSIDGKKLHSGWYRQITCAALNALLWTNILIACENNPNCRDVDDVAVGFYFPFTLADIRDIFNRGYDPVQLDAWERMQNID